MRVVVQRMNNSLSPDWRMLWDVQARTLLHSYFQGETHSPLYTANAIAFIFFPLVIKIHNYFQGLMFLFNSAVFYRSCFSADHFIPTPAQPGYLKSYNCVPTDHLKGGNKTLMALENQ